MRGVLPIKNRQENWILAILLTVSSVGIYLLQVIIFHRPVDTIFYLLQDLAFVPIEVALVTFIIHRFLNVREERKKTKKINVIISSFFTEVGTQLLEEMAAFNRNFPDICTIVRANELKKISEIQTRKAVKDFKYDLYADPQKLVRLREVFADKKTFLLSMLENSNLLEHDSFTDMLWAVFHVGDELQTRSDNGRTDFSQQTKADIDHLSNDLNRAFSAMVVEWINYFRYLHNEYPFLYELAKKKSPFRLASKEEYHA
jgi:hypothetical protein